MAGSQPRTDCRGRVPRKPVSTRVSSRASSTRWQTEGIDLHSLVLHRTGHVAVEIYSWPYGPDRPRVMHSVAKSFTACAIGMALADGRFALTDKVVDFFPEYLSGPPSGHLALMTVEDLLTMRTGHAEETSGSRWRGLRSSWIAEFFKIPVVYRPGTVYKYTSAASYMLSAILTRTTRETLHDYLRPRLFEPLGIQRRDLGHGAGRDQPGRQWAHLPNDRHAQARHPARAARALAGQRGSCPRVGSSAPPGRILRADTAITG